MADFMHKRQILRAYPFPANSLPLFGNGKFLNGFGLDIASNQNHTKTSIVDNILTCASNYNTTSFGIELANRDLTSELRVMAFDIAIALPANTFDDVRFFTGTQNNTGPAKWETPGIVKITDTRQNFYVRAGWNLQSIENFARGNVIFAFKAIWLE